MRVHGPAPRGRDRAGHDHHQSAAPGRRRRPVPLRRLRDLRRDRSGTDPRREPRRGPGRGRRPRLPPVRRPGPRRRRPPRGRRPHHPEPVWRTTCATLYRSDSRGPAIVFAQGFLPRDVIDGQYDIEQYVLVNQPSPYVSTTYDHDLYKTWYKSGYNYYIDAPGGVDVNRTIGDQHKWADQVEVAFPGGIRTEFVIGVCPVDKKTRTEKMSECESNPHYVPWH